MEPGGMTPLSLIGALMYCVTAALAVMAARRGAPALPMVRRNWLIVAAVFGALAIWRFTSGEALVQEHVREWTRTHAIYDDRHSFQIPVTIAILVVLAAAGERMLRLRVGVRSGQALIGAVMLALFSLMRMISLHAIDAILYRSIGPVHINYLIDIGLTLAIAALAGLDIARPESPPVVRSRRSGERRRRS